MRSASCPGSLLRKKTKNCFQVQFSQIPFKIFNFINCVLSLFVKIQIFIKLQWQMVKFY